jgi:hypothetical protein
LAVSYQGIHEGGLQLDKFFIGADGGLYVAWVVGTGTWNSPVRISRPNIAPPGASVAVGGRASIPLAVFPDSPSGTDAVLFSAQVNVFFIGNDGALYVAWVLGLGQWNDAVPISPPNMAPPGGHVAIGYQTSNQLDVFFVGNNGAIHVAWAATSGSGADGWNGPVGISPPEIVPAGGNMVANGQVGVANQLDVLFVGNNGALNVMWVVGGGTWQGPVGITPGGIAPPGAGVAASKQTNEQTDVFFVANNGALQVSWVVGGGTWQGPVGITPERIAPPGAGLVASFQTSDQLDVFFIANNGALHVSWVAGVGTWQGPVGITPEGLAPPGARLAAIFQTTSQLDVFVTGRERWVSWVEGGGTWQGPVGLAN